MNPTDRTLTEQNFLFHGMDFASVEYILERSSARSLAGKDIEKAVLARGLRYHVEDRVLVCGNKTIVFR